MLKYLVIELDYSSVSYCHYEKHPTKQQLIDLCDLKSGIFFAMKHNLNIQFVYPDYELPEEYNKLIETVDHVKIKPYTSAGISDATIIIVNGLSDAQTICWQEDRTYVLRISKDEIKDVVATIDSIDVKADRVNVVLCDMEYLTDEDFLAYQIMLESLASSVCNYGFKFKSNILSDRLFLEKMNNCNAGNEVITLAPNGRFYICPAYFYEDQYSDCGSPMEGVNIKNAHLYKCECAPICKHCDAYQCKRCVWLNKKLTLECNTPSHEQCVISHLERNASRLISQSCKHLSTMVMNDIPELDYLDPFDNRMKWNN